MSNPRVLHAIRRYGETSETFLVEVVGRLDRLGWEAVVASEHEPVNRDTFRFPPDERIVRPRRPSTREKALVRALRAARISVRDRRASWWQPVVEMTEPAVLHVHFGWLAGTVAFERLGVPFLVSFHGSDVRTWPHASEENRRDCDDLLRSLPVATASSESIARELRSLGYAGRLEVIAPGVPLDRFRFREPRHEAAAPRLLFVGRQVPCKGLDVLLAALPRVREHHPTATLRVIGEGQEAERCAQLVRALGIDDAVCFSGAASHDAVAETLRASDVLVVPSRTAASGEAEGSPVAPKEAYATGVPVVATSCGGIPEITPPAQRCDLVPENDAGALAEAIVKLLGCPESWRERALVARAWVETEFDSAELGRRLAALYADMAGTASAVSARPLGRSSTPSNTIASSTVSCRRS